MTDIMINGVSVVSIADYAKRRHLKVAFVQQHMIKGDDQNAPIEPVYKLNRTGMYSIEELDAAYLTRGSKGITLASMGYLHPAKAAELESRIRELVGEKLEAETNLQASEAELETALQAVDNKQAELIKYRELLDEQVELIKSLQGDVKRFESLALENGRKAEYSERARTTLAEALEQHESGHHN